MVSKAIEVVRVRLVSNHVVVASAAAARARVLAIGFIWDLLLVRDDEDRKELREHMPRVDVGDALEEEYENVEDVDVS